MASYSASSVSVGDIFGEATALIKRNLVLCGVGVLVMFLIKTGSDLGVRQWLLAGSPKAVFAGLAYLPVLGVIHYFLVTLLMQAEGMTEFGWSPGALASYFGAYFLAMIGLILGFILLIVPGIILAIRWSIYANFVIGRGLGPVAAIKASWEATRGSFGKIFLVLFILGLATGAGILLRGFGSQPTISTGNVIAGDIWTAVLSMVSLCVTTSIYVLLSGPDHTRLTEVFA